MSQKLLEDEPVPYKTIAIRDYRDLSRVYIEQIIQATQLRSIVMINCGGIIDLLGTLQQALDDEGGPSRLAEDLPHRDCRWYIIDSHRPYSLENVTADDDKVFILHDGELKVVFTFWVYPSNGLENVFWDLKRFVKAYGAEQCFLVCV